MNKYIVWVGGVIDYEGDDYLKARIICDEWKCKGYDDVILERVKA